MVKARSEKYWRDRELKHIKERIKDDKRISKKIASSYRETEKEIKKEIEAFYGRYATKEGLTIEEARKKVAKIDIEDYKKKAKKYVKEHNFTSKANEEMRLYNVTMKINRLEMLKRDIHLELIAMTSEQERMLYEEFTKGAYKEYERLSAILGETVSNNAKLIDKIVNSSFHTADWSNLIWANQEALRNELSTLLTRGIVGGRNPREMARDLRKKIGSSVYNSERIMRTEMARIQTETFKDSAEQLEINQYKWIAEPDACDECAELDDKVFNIDDMEYAKNAVPKHPNCRCGLAMYIPR